MISFMSDGMYRERQITDLELKSDLEKLTNECEIKAPLLKEKINRVLESNKADATLKLRDDFNSIAVQTKVGPVFETPASEIFNNINKLINDNVNNITSQINEYKRAGFTRILKFFKSELTSKRLALADQFTQEIDNVKKDKTSKPEEIITRIETIIQKYEEQNNQLSMLNEKEVSTGRLSAKMKDFKRELTLLKSKKNPESASIKTENEGTFKNVH